VRLRDRDVQHAEVVSEHVLVLQEDRRELREPLADLRARLLELLVGRLPIRALGCGTIFGCVPLL
jgi:hypothetical protein